MKKIITIVLSMFFVSSMAACGMNNTNDNIQSSIQSNDIVQEISKNDIDIVELDENSKITHDGDYVLSNMHSDILTDRSIHEGWFYYYSVGTENKVPWEEWKCAADMYTSCEILFDMQNLNNNPNETFIQRFTGFVVYNLDLNSIPACESVTEYIKEIRSMASQNTDTEIFEFTPLQRNPGQLDLNGYETRSKDAILLKNEETAQQDIIADVSEAFVRSWEDSNSKEPMWAIFSYDDNTVYVVNLRTQLVELVN